MSIVRLLLSLAFAGAFAGLAGIGVASLSGIGHRWADILAQFPGPAFAVAVGLVALCMVLRLTGAAWVGAAALIILGGAAWPQWFPPKSESAGGPVVRLYSANLWIGNEDVARVRRSVASADADVIMLLEVGDAMAAGLDVILADYPQRYVTPRRISRNGPVRYVVASRAPMTVTTNDPSPEGAARVQTVIGPIQFIPVHLTRPWPFQIQWEQIRQTGRAARLRHALEGPVVLAGDFNSVSSARIGRQMQAEAG